MTTGLAQNGLEAVIEMSEINSTVDDGRSYDLSEAEK